MRQYFGKGLLIALLMIVAAGLAVIFKPQARLADDGPKVVLEQLIPRQFGDWSIDDSIIPIEPSPDTQAQLDRIYNQTLSRAYVDREGRSIMLSIAYGGDQSSKAMQVHRPEVCYAAQGFQIHETRKDQISTPHGILPVKRVLAIQGGRTEPITYWLTVGDKAAIPGLRQRLIQIAYGLNGKVPDGMLVRISSIDPEPAKAYAAQEVFVRDLLAALPDAARLRIAGRAD